MPCVKICIQLLCILLFITFAYSNNIDSLVAKANIYYKPLESQQNGKEQELLLKNIDTLNSKENFKLIIHGFTGSRTHGSIKPLIDVYHENNYENVFVADWKDAAGIDYPTSRYAINKVSRHFGEILNEFLIKFSIDHTEVHLIGHSLGAHIVGGVGAYFNGTLGRITGLDPALPLFTPYSSDGLYSTSAQFVDVIHTDYPFFGDITPRGTIDFYPHFGRPPQRDCDDTSLVAVSRLVFEAYSCSHNRAVIFYAETVQDSKKYPTIPCSWNNILLRNTTACSLGAVPAENIVFMGESLTKNVSGYYYLN